MNLRNIAIIAHVDHGKTTLVDAMLKSTQTVKDEGQELIMDSGDLERERGITIKAKNASLIYKDTKINIIDTPGHADFGGEVERTLRMADGALLLVDAKEGPMPQTRFVLKKALELGLKAIVVINKIDKPDAHVEHAINKTFDLFVQLGATDEQLDFPIIYASGIRGIASPNLDEAAQLIRNPQPVNSSTRNDISPLLDAIIHHIPPPEANLQAPFSLLVLALAYDNYKGKLAIGKIHSGTIAKGQTLAQLKIGGEKIIAKVSALQMYQGLNMIDAETAEAGDIVAVAGFSDIGIGETLADSNNAIALPPVSIEPPTVKMSFGVNTSPFAGKEGKLLTSRQIRDRLMHELETNVALRVEETDKTDRFLVSGRGELHLAILIETMRREGFELEVSQPQVIYRYADAPSATCGGIQSGGSAGANTETNTQSDGKLKLEPYEFVTIDTPTEHQGVVIEELGRRGAEMLQMEAGHQGEQHFEYLMPTRGLIGLKNLLMTRTRGTAVLNNLFDSYKPVGQIDEHASDHGSLIASESGTANSYGLDNAQNRGTLFIGPGTEVYEGMVVGQNALNDDLEVNVCKTKKLSNMRTSSSDEAIILTPPKIITLDFALEYIGGDEFVEVTPQSIRIRKKLLSSLDRKRAKR